MVKKNSSDDEDENKPLLGPAARNVPLTSHQINASIDILSSESSATTVELSQKDKQSSFYTILSLWNAMMGTSILTMPWAIQQAGLSLGIICLVVVMGLCLYTAYRVIQLPSLVGVDLEVADYSDLCGSLLKFGSKWFAIAFSFIALIGAIIVYWILMSNFLFNIVTFIYLKSTNSSMEVIGNASHTDVYCPEPVPANLNHTTLEGINRLQTSHYDPEFPQIWNLQTTPVFLVVIVMLLVNYKSLAVLTKLSILVTIPITYLIAFIFIKAYNWGINVDLHDKEEWDFIPQYNSNFPALTGTLTLAYFIHNCVLPVVKNQKNPKNNARDLSIAYICVCLTYIIVGIVFYVSFPLNKLCIEDNLLNNFHNSDDLTFIARVALFVQMAAALPLIMFMIRNQLLHEIFPNRPHQYRHIIPINMGLIAIGVVFAIFYPHISFLIRYTGALCGLVYTFALPCLTYLKAMQLKGRLSKFKILIHGLLILFGAINLGAQFFVKQRF